MTEQAVYHDIHTARLIDGLTDLQRDIHELATEKGWWAERGWKVLKLAREAGVSQSTIRGIIHGTPPTGAADPLLSTCLRLAEALGVGIEELVGEREA